METEVEREERLKNRATRRRIQKAEISRKFRETHKDQINEQKRTQRYTCECGSELRHNEKATHEKTKKHNEYIEEFIRKKYFS